MHFVFLSITTVCEFTLQKNNKQTKKCNCAFSAYFLCEMNTNISLPSNSVKNWPLKILCMLAVHSLGPMLHSSLPCFKLNFNSQRGPKKWEKKKKKKRIGKGSKKCREHKYKSSFSYFATKYQKISLHFFFQLSICGKVQK